MIRSAFKYVENKCCKRNFATRIVKVYKFLPVLNKNLTGNKELNLPPATKIDEDTVDFLEKISLVGIEKKKGIQILEAAIQFADQILNVDTTGVKPLFTVLEDEALYLRDDIPKTDVSRAELLSHSKAIVENFYTTPISNQAYIPQEKLSEGVNLEKVCEN